MLQEEGTRRGRRHEMDPRNYKQQENPHGTEGDCTGQDNLKKDTDDDDDKYCILFCLFVPWNIQYKLAN